MEIEEFGDYSDSMYYGTATSLGQDVSKSDLQLQAATAGFFKEASFNREGPSIRTHEINPLMVRIGYSERDRNGKEKKIEVTVDTRQPPKETPSNGKEDKTPSSEAKKDDSRGK